VKHVFFKISCFLIRYMQTRRRYRINRMNAHAPVHTVPVHTNPQSSNVPSRPASGFVVERHAGGDVVNRIKWNKRACWRPNTPLLLRIANLTKFQRTVVNKERVFVFSNTIPNSKMGPVRAPSIRVNKCTSFGCAKIYEVI